MEPSSQAPPSPVRSAVRSGAPWRLLSVVLAAAVAAVATWLVVVRGAGERPPESLFESLQDRVLDGDGDAVWRECLPRVREDFAKFVRGMATNDDQGADEWRRKVGLSKQDLLALPPREVMSRENLAIADEFFRGAAVHRVDRWDEETALIHITTRTGWDRRWVVKRVGGEWKVDNFWPTITQGGRVVPRDGEKRREGLVPGPEGPK